VAQVTASAIYQGRVQHRRHTPVEHGFEYRLFMLYLDLDELPDVLDCSVLWSAKRPALGWFRDRDYLDGASGKLASRVRRWLKARTGRASTGPIRLLTHARTFGFVFNPVSFYYCFDPRGERVETIVAEIDNTPWGERHHYLLAETDNLGTPEQKCFEFDKAFHVSPFLGMRQRYAWSFGEPGSKLWVRMQNLEADRLVFDATLALERCEMDGKSLARVLASHPLMPARVVGAIYWNALRLALKRAPFHPHPRSGRV
jgi:DUF1365 family protein